MSKQTEALKLALEALEEINKLSIGENAICLPAEIDTAMDAIREALAEQPAPVAEVREQQEPVAWRSWNDHDGYGFWETKQEAEPWCAPDFFAEPIYTSPPASKPWVGLTDEEKSDLWCKSTGRDCVNEDTHVFADAIEAKLREKNA